MFIGHFGVGLGAKAWTRRASLGTLFMAVQFLDLLSLSHLTLTTGIDRNEMKMILSAW
jgi:hypothetical protein